MKLPKVEIVKCQCGPICQTHGLSFGSFYQGCGWTKEEAEEIARRINGFEVYRLALEKIKRTSSGKERITAAMALNEVANKVY